jgi:uncharacterized membrane protein YjjP (DUF1212 family)
MAPVTSDFKSRTRFIIKLGRTLHECGASSERIERHLNNTTELFGLHGSFLVSPTTFTCAFWEDDEHDQFVHIERVQPSDYNLGKLWEVDQLVQSVEQGKVPFDQGMAELERLRNLPPLHSFQSECLAWLLTGGCFSLLLSPGLFNSLTSSVISLLIFLIVRQGAARPAWQPVATILGALGAGLIADTAAATGLPINPPLVVLSSIIIFIPGLALTVSLTEISMGHLISGSSRLVDAVMTLLKLFFGAASGIALSRLFYDQVPTVFDHLGSTGDLPDWRIWPALVGLAVSLGIGLNLPRHRFGWGTLSLMIAFISATVTESHLGPFAGLFVGALVVGLFANLFARITQGPASVLTTYGVIVLVPGSKVYSILNQWVSGESILPTQSAATALMAFVTLTVGLLFANALLPARKSL